MDMVIHVDRAQGLERDITLSVRDGRLSMHCGCATGAHGQVCCHVLELLLATRDGDATHAGRADGIAAAGGQLLERLRRLLPAGLLAQLDEPQALLDGQRFAGLCDSGLAIGPTAQELLCAPASAEPPVAPAA